MLIFFFNDTATTEIYTLSLHDALPIYRSAALQSRRGVAHERGERQDVSRRSRELRRVARVARRELRRAPSRTLRSEEHTSELQSPCNLVCRLLLEKKNQAHMAVVTVAC